MNLFITGGAGFIGSNLCEFYLHEGNFVTCYDNFSTGKIDNIIDLYEQYPNNFKIIVGDILDFEKLSNSLSEISYDIILHQAALGSVPRSIEKPILYIQNNSLGFSNILEVAKLYNIKKIIYASSSSIYGDSEGIPKIENIIGEQLSPYAYTKYTNELCAKLYHRCYGIDTIGFRYFNVYGKHQNPYGNYAAVIPKFITKLINKESPVIYGSGKNTRDFTFIEDIIQIVNLAVTSENPNIWNQVYNAAFGGRTSINTLYKLISSFLSEYDQSITEIKPIYKEKRKGEVIDSLANIENAINKLGYKPNYSIEDGLRKTIRWYIEK